MLHFVLMSTSLLLKKCWVNPRRDLAFLTWAVISRSSFSSVVMSEPKYLKLCVNQMCWLSGSLISGGKVLLALRDFASLRDSGKNMASVLDFISLLPTCICIPSLLKCLMRVGVRVLRSSRLSVMKTLSSMKKELFNSKGVPWEEVGCFVRWPFKALRFPILGGLKYWSSDGLIPILCV